MEYRQIQVIGGKGSEPGQFATSLRCVAVDAHGQLFAAGDSGDQGLRCGRQAEAPLGHLAPAALGGGGGRWRRCMPAKSGQIEIFDGAGKLIDTWRDEALLGRVTAIGFVGDGVLAGDAADRAIRRFDRHGKFLNNIGKNNPVNGFLIPNGVVDFGVDAQGVIHAANPGQASRGALPARWRTARAHRTL